MLAKALKVEDHILDVLNEGQQNTLDLIQKVKVRRPQTTKQAIYKALRVLRGNETIVQNREEVALSSVWIRHLLDFAQKAELNYKHGDRPSINFLQLKQGEKISYTFTTFEATDMFWTHAVDVLSDVVPSSYPIFLYNPHEWFLLARHETEMDFFDHATKTGKKIFLIAGNKDPLDIHVSKYFDGKKSNYYASQKALFPKDNYYCNVFNDFVVEAWLDPKTSKMIDVFYKKTKGFDKNIQRDLLEIIRQKGRNKLVISRNKRKADTIRQIFKGYFWI